MKASYGEKGGDLREARGGGSGKGQKNWARGTGRESVEDVILNRSEPSLRSIEVRVEICRKESLDLRRRVAGGDGGTNTRAAQSGGRKSWSSNRSTKAIHWTC